MKKLVFIVLTLTLMFALSACVTAIPHERDGAVPDIKDLPNEPSSSLEDSISPDTNPAETVSPNQPAERPTDGNCTPSLTSDPDVVTAYKILDTSKGLDIDFATAIEEVYEDSEAVYCFSVIKSHYIIVYFTDGSEMNIKDALHSGLLTISEAKELGVRFIEESKNLTEK